MHERDKAKSVTEATRHAVGFAKKKAQSPFKGLLKCGYCGGSFGITYSRKKGRRYSYYFCVKDDKRAVSECPVVRVPAGEVDKIILQQLLAVFRAPSLLVQIYLEAGKADSDKKEVLLKRKAEFESKGEDLRREIFQSIKNSGDDHVLPLREELQKIEMDISLIKNDIAYLEKGKMSHKDICDSFSSVESLWNELFPGERYRLTHLLIENVTIFKESIRIELKIGGMTALAQEVSAMIVEGAVHAPQKIDGEKIGSVKPTVLPNGNIALNIPIRMKHKNGRKVIIAPNALDGEVPDAESPVKEPIVKALARAHAWLKLLDSGQVTTITQLADRLNLHRSYVSRIMRLVNLAPDIQESIITGSEADSLSIEKMRCSIPADWKEQRTMFSFN